MKDVIKLSESAANNSSKANAHEQSWRGSKCFTNSISERRRTLKRWSVSKVFAMIAVCAIMGSIEAQITVLPNGDVGVGTTNPYAKFQVNVGSKSIVLIPSDNGGQPCIGAYNAQSGDTRIDFWHPISKYNKLRFKGYLLSSDSTLKTDIIPLTNITDTLKRIRTYSFYYKTDSLETRKRDYGVLAQEIAEVLPELIDTAMEETMLVNYNAFVALLIKGFNEQQTVIETQQAEIGILQKIALVQEIDLHKLQKTMNEMQEILKCFCGRSGSVNPEQKCCENLLHRDNNSPQDTNNNNNLIKQVPILYQNTPNPFTANTEISCDIPTAFTNAFIYIYNLQGVELMSFPIVQTGYSTVTVFASALPAGMYLYTLVVDNQIVDTKRMILTK